MLSSSKDSTSSLLTMVLPLMLLHQGHKSSALLLIEAGWQQVLLQPWRRALSSHQQPGSVSASVLQKARAWPGPGPFQSCSLLTQRSIKPGMGLVRSQTTLMDRLPPSLKQAISLHAGALWQRHKNKVYVGAGLVAVWLVWRVTFSVATTFWTVTQTMADWGFMALAVAAVAAGAQYARWHFGLNPSTAYRQAMLRLNTSPAVLEVMGAPLIGSDLHASIMTGGNLYLSRKAVFKPKISSRRLQMLFPLRGAERDGLVSMEVKKKGGRHVFKMLAVDVRPAAGVVGSAPAGARIFVEGNQVIYDKSGALGALRDPFLKALHFQKEMDRDEEQEEEEEEARQQQLKAKQAEAKKKAADAASTTSSPAAKPAAASPSVPAAPKPAAPAPTPDAATSKAAISIPDSTKPAGFLGSLNKLMFGGASEQART